MIQPARESVVECLRELSSLEFQERVWVRGEGPEVSSFPELVSQLFDDTTLGDRLEAGDVVFGAEADAALKELSRIVDRFPHGIGARDLIAHPQWHVVLELADRALVLISNGTQRVSSESADP